MRKRCPVCRSEVVRILYGLPTQEAWLDAEEGRVVLAGCLRDFDEPKTACTECGARVWPGGTYSTDEGLGVVLARRGKATTVGRVRADGRLEVVAGAVDGGAAGDGGVTSIAAEDRSTVLVMLCVEAFESAEDLLALARRHSVPAFGTASGPVERFFVDDDGSFVAVASTEIEVPAPVVDRFTLAVLADGWRHGRFAGEDGLRGWLDDHGVSVETVPTVDWPAVVAAWESLQRSGSSGEWVVEPGRFPFFMQSEGLFAFTTALYEAGVMEPFDWPAWAREAEAIESDRLESADLETLRRMLLVHVRSDRFTEGHLATAIEDGRIGRIIARAQALLGDRA